MRTPALIALALLAASGAAAADGSLRGLVGTRQLSGNTWEAFDADRQTAFGLQGDLAIGQGPLHLSATLFASGRSEDDDRIINGVPVDESSVSVVDLAVGLKLMPRAGQLRPYAGLGLSSTGVAAEYEDEFGDDEDDSDQTFGYYLNAGLDIAITRRFHAGLDLRWLRGFDEVELFGLVDEVDSVGVSGTFGWVWGK
ncbi:MAG TPA: outer membrane beta-barrel protein [Solimonas sp.]|nr:outer membrane beta-barrel protein [Solimonas sp.]